MHDIHLSHHALLVERVQVFDNLLLDSRLFLDREVAAQAVGGLAAGLVQIAVLETAGVDRVLPGEGGVDRAMIWAEWIGLVEKRILHKDLYCLACRRSDSGVVFLCDLGAVLGRMGARCQEGVLLLLMVRPEMGWRRYWNVVG